MRQVDAAGAALLCINRDPAPAEGDVPLAAPVRFSLVASGVGATVVLASVVAGASLTSPHEELDRIIQGLAVMLERSADTDACDTTPGKLAFLRYASSLVNE